MNIINTMVTVIRLTVAAVRKCAHRDNSYSCTLESNVHTKYGQALKLDRPVDLIGAYCEVPTSTIFEEVLQHCVLILESCLL